MEKVVRRVLTANGMTEMEFTIKKQPEQKLEVSTEESTEEVVEDKDIMSMSDAELKAKCEELGLSKKGSKSAKINRILEATTSGEDSL